MVKRAVLIGIDQYEDPDIEDLSGCVNDVESMAAVLGERYEFESDNVTKLIHPGDNTRKGILDALRLMVDSTEHGDVAVVYYSGHGSQIRDTENEEKDGWDETIVPSDTGRSGHPEVLDIVDDELSSYIVALAQRTPYTTFIFDSCHSGSIDRDLIRPGTVQALREASRPVPRATLPARQPLSVPPLPFPETTPKTGAEMSASGLILQGDYLLIAGCRDDEVSMEAQFGAESHGLLTNFLVEGLRAGSASTMEAIVAKVRVEVEEEAKRRDKRQRPVFEGPSRLRGARPFSPVESTKAPAGTDAPGPPEVDDGPDGPAEPDDDDDKGGTVQVREWDAKFAGRSAVGILAVLILAGLAFWILTCSVLDDQDGSTKVATTFVVELLFAGLLLGAAGAYIALLDQRGRSHAVENVLTAATGPKTRGDGAGIGADQVKGVFEALGKMPTARGLIAVGGLVIVGAIALAWHVLPESSAGKAPTISKQPTPVKSRPGGKALFSVSSEGTDLSYEWQRNGKAITSAASSPTLAIRSVKKAENGDLFSAVVANDNGETVSKGAKLTVEKKKKS